MNNEKNLRDSERALFCEVYHCTKVAYEHQQSKETCAALKLRIKEIKEKIKKEAENVKK